MKLIRFGAKGEERPGIAARGGIVDLEKYFPGIPDIGEEFFENGWPEKIRELDAPGEIHDIRIGPPIANPGKIICLGKNYAAHVEEGSFELPKTPILFNKTLNTLNGPFDPISIPKSDNKIDWEVELAVVIGKKGKAISRDKAFSHIAGYTVLNDVSAREAQFSDTQWFRGKSFDTFAPMGPAIVTKDEITEPMNLNLSARVNDTPMQEGNTSQMIFDIAFIVEFISQDITLYPGDIISTGTPSGVGCFRDPPVYLLPGDIVECRVEGIGCLRNRCIAPET